MITTYSINELRQYHKNATDFFASQLVLLKETVPKITNERLVKPALLLISCGQTGAAIIQLSRHIDSFTSELAMLSRSFIEKVINFCYVGVCDEQEYHAFLLHPIYKQYHNMALLKMNDNFEDFSKIIEERERKQTQFKKLTIVQEALSMFSETKHQLQWTKKTLNQRIEVIEKWGKVLDVFFTLSKLEYYSDASESLHGSLYGCTYGFGAFDPDFDSSNQDELEKKLYKDNTCILLQLGIIIHETFTLINYSNDIKDTWSLSNLNRNNALKLLFHVIEKPFRTKS